MSLQVSWVRHRDVHLLTVGHYTYTSDQRFRAIHQPHSEDWMLQIKYPQHRDSGIYECQVSSTPHLSHFVHLTVIGESPDALLFIRPIYTFLIQSLFIPQVARVQRMRLSAEGYSDKWIKVFRVSSVRDQSFPVVLLLRVSLN